MVEEGHGAHEPHTQVQAGRRWRKQAGRKATTWRSPSHCSAVGIVCSTLHWDHYPPTSSMQE